MQFRTLFVMLTVAAAAGAVSGCSLVGKRRVELEEGKTEWQVRFLSARGFDDEQSAYLLALYDGNIPPKQNLSILQLWSGTTEKEKK